MISHNVVFQGQLFVRSVLWGMCLMLSYDGLRLFRIFVRQRQWLLILEEALFWLITGGWVYMMLYRYHNGAVRNYIVFGMGTGMVVYRWLLSPIVIRQISAVVRILAVPIGKICRIFKTFVKNAENTLQSILSKGTIKIRKLRQKKREDHDGRG